MTEQVVDLLKIIKEDFENSLASIGFHVPGGFKMEGRDLEVYRFGQHAALFAAKMTIEQYIDDLMEGKADD